MVRKEVLQGLDKVVKLQRRSYRCLRSIPKSLRMLLRVFKEFRFLKGLYTFLKRFSGSLRRL